LWLSGAGLVKPRRDRRSRQGRPWRVGIEGSRCRAGWPGGFGCVRVGVGPSAAAISPCAGLVAPLLAHAGGAATDDESRSVSARSAGAQVRARAERCPLAGGIPPW